MNPHLLAELNRERVRDIAAGQARLRWGAPRRRRPPTSLRWKVGQLLIELGVRVALGGPRLARTAE